MRVRSYLTISLIVFFITLWSPVYLQFPLGLAPGWAQTAASSDERTEAQRLFQQALQQNSANQVTEAIASYRQSLALYQSSQMRVAYPDESQVMVAAILANLGGALSRVGEHIQAIEVLQQALKIQTEVGDRQGQVYSLSNLGTAHLVLGQYAEAIAAFQQALPITQTLKDTAGEGFAVFSLGRAYQHLGQYPQAREFLQQALEIQQQLQNPAGEAQILTEIGAINLLTAQYPQAIEVYQQSAKLQQQLGDHSGEAHALSALGTTYRLLGQLEEAIAFHEQALALYRDRSDSATQQPAQQLSEIGTLMELANIKVLQTHYSEAIEFYQQALTFARSTQLQAQFPGESRRKEGYILQGMGVVYGIQAQYSQASEFLQQALTIAQEMKNRSNEAQTLENLANIYRASANYSQASESYHQVLMIQQELGDRAGEGITLNNLGLLLEELQQPELAIVALKQSVNVREAIRQDLRVLPQQLQQSYTATISETYRSLADLLFQQDRVLEAQQVLDLLKVQELEEYLQNVRGNEHLVGITLLPAEQQILTLYTRATQTHTSFETFIQQPELTAQITQLKVNAREQTFTLDQLTSLQDNLKQVKDAVLLYPLVLKDRVEIVLIRPDAPPVRHTIAVDEPTFKQAIADFREQISNPRQRKSAAAQQLYIWLIQPFETELKAAKTIFYAADGQLRYVPLGALYDGQRWLIERFNINYITSASLTDFSAAPVTDRPLRVLAGGFSQGQVKFNVGDQTFQFSGLPNAATEIENIAARIPETTELLNQQFSRAATLPQMDQYTIVHFATHAEFVVGAPEDSFILLGNGDRVSLREIESWQLPHVDLVVLSACKTAVGGKLGNGEEILGLGYQMQRTGARATIASLWSVDDGGTQVLMNAFYAALTTLRRSGLTKAEALRTAQIALITGNFEDLGIQASADLADFLSRPYYWAPFILIGNGV
jgi:CHAT domain-containing protein/tetratricopeptide (TPR) repeat protein